MDNSVPESNLFDSYIVPPFSTLDTRSGAWQKRKSGWVEVLGHIGETEDSLLAAGLMAKINSGTSFFDPVLAEIIITWFSRPGWKVLNPFCGEATVAALSSVLGRPFIGIDIRKEQVDKNTKILWDKGYRDAQFLHGNSIHIDDIFTENSIDPTFDLIFSSPPYYDLEIYSSGDGDVSNMGTYEEFITAYKEIFRKSISHLNDDRFVVVKVSEIRDEKGAYRNFVGDNIRIFRELGLHYYNEIILVNSVGTGALRARNTFSGRKVVRLHQNVLVFFKGDMSKIQEVLGREPEIYKMPAYQTGSLFYEPDTIA